MAGIAACEGPRAAVGGRSSSRPGLQSWNGRPAEHAEHGQALEVGNGGSEEGLQASFPTASVTGLAHAKVLEVVDLPLY
jgi:hypothetical protein